MDSAECAGWSRAYEDRVSGDASFFCLKSAIMAVPLFDHLSDQICSDSENVPIYQVHFSG
jgi:hypothetical protein